MTDHKRTYSQRGDDYRLEAWKVCEKEKPAPHCPYCGNEMKKRVLSDYKTLCFWLCPKCSATSPSADTAESAYAAAMQRCPEPNRALMLEEVREHCKQDADAAPLWVEFHNVPSVSRWMAAYKTEGAFAFDIVQYYLTSFEDGYNRVWRCWLRKPTQEEMEAVPWEKP